MERRNTMLGLLGLNVLFYLIDLFLIYHRYLADPYRYVGVFNFEILYSFMLSMVLMIPAVMSYFTLFNYLKEERTELVGQMFMMTMLSLVFVIGTVLYINQI